MRHFDFAALKVIIIASPGFTKEAVHQYFLDEAVVRPLSLLLLYLRSHPALRNKATSRLRRRGPNSSSCTRLHTTYTR